MSIDERKTRFQVIQMPSRVPAIETALFESATQGLLFPIPKEHLLVFLVFPLISEDQFTRVLELTKPAAVLELRRSPRFDIGQLNRQEAFRWFKAAQAKYYDLASVLSPEEASPNSPVQLVQAFLNGSGSQITGPIMLLMNSIYFEQWNGSDSITTQITRLFASTSKHSWEAIEIPQFA